jgi:uncharacterized iron-regulated membrane protein
VRIALWERWLRRPKSLWLRKALFQIHLWTGVALGLYVFVISVSGSAIVFRNELYKVLWPGSKTVAISGPRLTHEQLRDAALRAYPHYRVSWIWDARRPNQAPNQAIEIWLDRKGHKKERLFDPYTGLDLGESTPYSIQLIAWLIDLHVNLLAGERGRLINGACAVIVLALAFTGAVLWWPGTARWRRSLTIQTTSNWKLFNWELHNVIGFWMLPVVLMFAFVGFYGGFPRPVQVVVNNIAPLDVYGIDGPVTPSTRSFRPKLTTGDQVIRWISYLHFGNFGGWPSKAVWVVIGFVPAFLFVTGLLMWWNRVLGPAVRRVYNCRSWPRKKPHFSPSPESLP